MSCIFCKIAAGEMDTKFIYEDEKIVVFHDLNPQAPTHVLLIPKEHIESSEDINDENKDLIAHIFSVIPKLSKTLGLEKGYRIVNNCKEDGGQSVDHIHFHLLGGRSLTWPPG